MNVDYTISNKATAYVSTIHPSYRVNTPIIQDRAIGIARNMAGTIWILEFERPQSFRGTG
jgi:hypothetical protein